MLVKKDFVINDKKKKVVLLNIFIIFPELFDERVQNNSIYLKYVK